MASSDAAVIVALATHPAQRAWLNHRHNRGGDERGAAAPAARSSLS
jgi:hypothetical protein